MTRHLKKSRLSKTVLAAACALLPLAAMPAGSLQAQAVTAPSQDILLSIGRGQLVTVPGQMADIFVANDQVADVQVKSQRQLYVFGKSGGETTVYASNGSGNVIWSANIRVGSNLDSIDQMLTLAMPQAKINVATMGTNTVLLTGTVGAPEDAAEAERLVQAFVGEDSNVISRLRMATPLQVSLRVRFAEVSRSLVRTLGANINTYDASNGFKFGIGQGRGDVPQYYPNGPLWTGTEADEGISVVPPSGSGSTIVGAGKFLGLNLLGSLDAAEQEGLVTTLAEPNLVALSGETAQFLAGGEFPVPASGGLGTTAIEYKSYGVSLAYTPTVLANGRISLRVRPEVSELTSQGAVTLNGFNVPGLTVRRAETSVELGSGQSFMIAGLLSNNANNTIDKLPGAGDVPILGNLFKSTEFRKGQSELVIVVTPFLVKPVDDSKIVLPTDGFHAPTFAEQLLLNKDNAGVSGESRPMPRAAGTGNANPEIGAIDHGVGELADHRRRKPAREEQQAEAANAAEPGFSLK
ncbi:pilus assembly protein CpaC [Altererythrobacter atlanticus]|uniref:Type II secretion system protein D n=1 Tax=Croceibacterium atlanticum TaxID=1267766 RepID=A0A0F7KT96_9SPHN|nr:type II and III secretion system protein family protein [Croceibacterium atlanticum]AKH42447.1 Type II secretion system protein D precursor [Croceibacterium atlanticum]MBB5731224.1 pilus assembly protein CpaC [Croceibacterium atlanticum]